MAADPPASGGRGAPSGLPGPEPGKSEPGNKTWKGKVMGLLGAADLEAGGRLLGKIVRLLVWFQLMAMCLLGVNLDVSFIFKLVLC
jgi:hypothetical protein